MNVSWNNHFVLLAVTLSTFLPSAISIEAQTPDISGAAQLIFGRLENPQIAGGHLSRETTEPPTTLKEKVDDALALGNAARVQKPPDLDSAERAYRLAWKLNPRDPRPYVGLGNIYMDRGKYAEAAKAYQEAIRFGPTGGGSLIRTVNSGNASEAARTTAQSHAHFGAALLADKNFRKAEKQLEEAIAAEPRNAAWRAWLGYCLAQEERFTEAAAAFKMAVQLDVDSQDYKALLSDAVSRAKKASTQDLIIRKELEGTTWETLSDSKIRGNCRLSSQGDVRCTGMPALESLMTMWKVQDGLLELIRPATAAVVCSGRVAQKNIQLNCLITAEEIASVWTQSKSAP